MAEILVLNWFQIIVWTCPNLLASPVCLLPFIIDPQLLPQ